MDEIFIKDIEIFAYHGVFDFEKKNGQTFYVSARIWVEELTDDDNLLKTIHYGEVAEMIDDFVKNTKFNLIESVANGIAKKILMEYTLAREVEVTVKKPDAPIPLKFDNVMVTVRKKKHIAYIGLGSNMGDKKAYLDGAIDGFDRENDTMVLRKSKYIVTPPYGVTDQEDFLNGCIMIETLKSPRELLGLCARLEQEAGRVRVRRWGERTLDVDILAYDDAIINEPDLIIPHIEMHMRRFVLEPLNEIASGYVHPVLRKTVYSLLKELER